MNNPTAAPSQARSFTAIFLIEMWERFGFYGMQALIVYYMVQRLGFPDERATLVWGAAAALIYVAPAIGGWIGDKVLGTRRTMLLGAVVLAILATTWAFFRCSAVAGWLLVPYLACMTFAAVVNVAIWRLNLQ